MHLLKVYFTTLVSIWLYQSVIAQGASRNLIEDSPFLPPGYQTAAERAKKKLPPPKPITQKNLSLSSKATIVLAVYGVFVSWTKRRPKATG